MQDLTRYLPPRDTRDRTAVLELAHDLVAAIGGRHLLITGIPLPRGDIRPLLLRMDWPDAWAARYLRGGLWRADPMVAPSQGVRSFVRADELLRRDGTPEQTRDLLRDAGEAGLGGLISFPFMKVGAYQLALVAAFGAVDDATLLMARAVLQGLVDHLHEVSPDSLARPGQLTARERQIVAETAVGKTSAEIASDLDISARTVFAHLTAAGGKLGASNKTSTVVEAIRYGQIEI